jgi:protein disulfide-isomerase A6
MRLQSIIATALSVVAGANAASAVVDLIPDNFDDVVLKSGKPALVEFFAPWCGRMSIAFPIC